MPRFFRRALVGAAALALGLTGAVIVATPAAAAGCTVTDGGDNAATDGTLRYAIETFNGGDDCAVITIQAGLTVTLSAPITLDVGVTFTGGFNTRITRDSSFDMFELAPGADPAQAYQFDNITFDGDNGLVPGAETGRAFHTPGGMGVGPYDSFTTNNCAFNNFTTDGIGGAIFLSGTGDGPVEFSVTSFGSNDADNSGGAAYVQGAASVRVAGNGLGAGAADGNYAGHDSNGSGGAFEFGLIAGNVTIQNYRFTDNHALDGVGGAVALNDIGGDVLIDTVQFGDDAAGNEAQSSDPTSPANGGGASITNVAGDITVSNSTFRQNEAGGSGGGLWIEDTGDSEIEDVSIDTGTVFQQNEAGTDPDALTPGVGGGAGIVGAQSLRVTQSEFGNALVPDPQNWGNEADSGGGLWFGHISGTTTILETGFNNNEASDGNGGGFGTSENGSIAVSASIFATNHADGDGGGAYIEELNSGATVSFDSTDFSNNTAELGGGAISVDSIPESLALTTDQFTGNYAVHQGGGAVEVDVIEDGANFTVRSSQFIDNGTEGSDGGALYVDQNNEVLFIDSSTFSENFMATTNDAFGTSLAVEENNGTTRIMNSTSDEFETDHPLVFVGTQGVTGLLQVQSSTLNGSARTLFVGENGGASQLINSIFGAPTGEPAIELAGGSLLNLSYSLVSSAFEPSMVSSAATNRFGVTDMKLAPLAVTPGTDPAFLLTRVPLVGSPALKAGDATASYLPDFDQRGSEFPRVSAGGLDIGAVQTDLIPPLPATGSTIPLWIPIVGAVILLVGIAAIAFTVVSRRRLRALEAPAVAPSDPTPPAV
jgi:predicted outer membrane repeat protein